MRRAKTKTCIVIVALAFECSDSRAGGSEPPWGTPKAVGAETVLRIGERAQDVVVAREVHWSGRSFTSRVLYSTNTHEALMAPSGANRLCMLNGRLFAVGPGSQSVLVARSVPLGAETLSVEKATEFCQRVFRGQPGMKRVDLRGLLEAESRATKSAAMLLLRDVTIRPEETNLVVNFESFTRLKGTVRQTRATKSASVRYLRGVTIRAEGANLVVNFESSSLKGNVRLDPDLNVISMGLNGAPGDK